MFEEGFGRGVQGVPDNCARISGEEKRWLIYLPRLSMVVKLDELLLVEISLSWMSEIKQDGNNVTQQ